MSTNLERKTLAASCSGIPGVYEAEDSGSVHKSELKSDEKLKSSPSVHSLPVLNSVPPLDYRQLLLEKRRNSLKNSWHNSESDDSNDGVSDGENVDNLATSNGHLLLCDDISKDQKLNGLTSSKASEEKMSVNEIDLHLSNSACPEKHLLSSVNQVILKISIPEQTLTKCLRIELIESVWNAKQMVLKSLAVPLPDPLNYGLFSNDLGGFLLDHKLVSEYVPAGQVAFYELRYKTRVYSQPVRPGAESRRLCKMQGDSKRKELMRYIRQRNVEKLCRLLNKGVDPNFHTPHDGETPLTTVIANYNPGVTESVAFEYVSVPVMKALVKGGAHFDFRNQQGFTPLHVAVRNGNAQAVETLLSLGAPPDSLDNNEYTPLYHCALSDTSADCIAPLCLSGADITCVNSQKWTILHQICRHSRLAHLMATIEVISSIKGAERLLNMQNESGNTALHMCAIYNVQHCLVALLNAGIDKTIRNYSHQDAFQVAVVATNMNTANLIQDFPKLSEQEISMLMTDQEPEVITAPKSKQEKKIKRRHTISAAVHNKNSRSAQRQNPFGKKPGALSLSGTDIEIVSHTLSRGRSVDTSVPATSMGSVASSSDVGDASSNKIGTSTDETYSLVEDPVYSLANDAPGVTETNYTSFAGKKSLLPFEIQQTGDPSPTSSSDSNVKAADDIMMRESGDVGLQATSHPDLYHRYRHVSLSRGNDGYGFVLRGAKDKSIESFAPTARHPGLQYLESVEIGSNAHRAGLRDGDFVLKINGIDVTCMGHKQTVDVIRKLRDPLRLHVCTVVSRPNELDFKKSIKSLASPTTSSTMTSSARLPSSPGGIHRSESIRSAIGKLDSVLALEEANGNSSDNTATLRRRPISRKLRSQDIEEIFRFDGGAFRKSESDAYEEPAKRNLRMCVSASSRLVRVLPPTVPTSTSVPVDQISRNDASYSPQNHLNRANTFTATASSPAMGSNHATRHPNHLSSPSSNDSRGPPLPPERRDSRLTDSDAGSVSTQRTPPFSPATAHYHGSPAVSNVNDHSHSKSFGPSATDNKLDFSGFASEAILQAQRRQQRMSSSEGNEKFSSTPITHHLVSKPPPTVAPKPGRGKSNPSHPKTFDATEDSKSAFSLAIEAKHEKLRQRSQTGPTPVVTQNPVTVKSTVRRNEDVVDSRKPTDEELRELMQLPPPPPIPTNDPSSPLYYNLPPPPPPSGNANPPNSFDQGILPPPPDSMLSSPSSNSKHTVTSNVNKRKENQQFQHNISKFNDRFASIPTNGVDSGSSADSGVYEFAAPVPQPITESKPNVDTSSVVSSVSTLSSEDGSDVGVSLAYDHKSSPEKNVGNMYLNVLKKKSSQSNAATKSAPNMVLTKVSFTGSKGSISTEPTKPTFAPAKEPTRNLFSAPAPATKPIKTAAPAHVPVSEPVRNVTPAHVPADEPKRKASNHVVKSPVIEKVAEPAKKAAVAENNDVTSKPVLDWTVEDVCKWLTGLGLASYTDVFAENEIVGSHLPDLSKDDLQELGITRVGHRLTFERSLKKLLSP